MIETLSTQLTQIQLFLIAQRPVTIEDFTDYFLHILFIAIALQAIQMIWRLIANKGLGVVSKPFTMTEERERKILILGDSTAVGTGASRPEDTIGGRLARDYPDSQIINVAVNGSRITDLPRQVAGLTYTQFDLVIISAGGNDVWHFTRLKKIRKALEHVLPTLSSMSNSRVIFLVYNNIGSVPLFPSMVQWFLDRRSLHVQKVIHEETAIHKIPIIDLFANDPSNPFLKNPEGLFSRDGIHPSSRGYEMWYNRMWREMTNRGYRYQ